MLSLYWLLYSCLNVQSILCLFVLLFLVLKYAKRTGRHVDFDAKGRAVLITGCDSGFGNLLARQLLNMGFHVFVTCLFPDGEGAQSLKEQAPSPTQLKIIRLDVTSDKEIAHVKQFVENNLPEKGLWGLVNNAGISMWGISEWHSIDKYKQIVDINLLGAIRTTLAFAPLIRKSKGRMVFLSSKSAFLSVLNGLYSMTKAALEKFCDSLRIEMKQLGVMVCIIEPGNYSLATNIQPRKNGDEVWNSIPDHMREVYGKEYVTTITNKVNNELNNGSRKAYEVIDAIVDALMSDNPKPRYFVGSLREKLEVFLATVCPTSVTDCVLSLVLPKIK